MAGEDPAVGRAEDEGAEMLNKTIWLLWLQGWDQAPWLVRQVARSWEVNNPGWKIEHVDLDNLRSHVGDVDYLYDDRKDRSILFWKSLPASDTVTIASKLLTAMVVAPLMFGAVYVITQLVTAIIGAIMVHRTRQRMQQRAM